MLTKQQMFDKAYLGVIAQGGPSMNEIESLCLYRDTGRNRRCGVGHVITDEAYDPEIENIGVNALIEDTNADSPKLERALAASGVDVDDDGVMDFLRDMQSAHDTAAGESTELFIGSFEHRMAIVATTHALTVPEVA
jgi:hypothetical protein